MVARARKPDESYEDYRENLRAEADRVKDWLWGSLIHNSTQDGTLRKPEAAVAWAKKHGKKPVANAQGPRRSAIVSQ